MMLEQTVRDAGAFFMSIDLSEFNWQLILIIAAISMTVSYMGDVLGMRIGKKRISLFGLRPKYTSTVITIFTGFGVAALTLAVAAYTSEPIRSAMFGERYLNQQITRLTNDLHDRQSQLDEMEMQVYLARGELQSLEAEKEDLKHGLAEMKEGRVIAFQGELLAQTSVEGGATRSAVENALTRLVQTAEENLSMKLENVSVESQEFTGVVLAEEARGRIEDELLSSGGRKVLRLAAPSNVVMGQTVEGVVDVFDSRKIYESGTVIKRETVRRSLDSEIAADLLYTLLKEINRMAVAEGVLPDPISGAVGNLDSMDFFEAVDKVVEVANSGGSPVITFLAATDIYTEGPVNIRVQVSSADDEN